MAEMDRLMAMFEDEHVGERGVGSASSGAGADRLMSMFQDDHVGERIVHRYNPFGRFQLGPVRRAYKVQDGIRIDIARSDTSAGAGAQQLVTQDPEVSQPSSAHASVILPAASQPSSSQASVVLPADATQPSSSPAAASLDATDGLDVLGELQALQESLPQASLSPQALLPPDSPASPPVPPASRKRGRPPAKTSPEPAAAAPAAAAPIVQADAGKTPGPQLPKFAFEWFRLRRVEEDGKESPLGEHVKLWLTLPDEERKVFKARADKDRDRYEEEYDKWQQERHLLGESTPPMNKLIADRRRLLETKLSRAGNETDLDAEPELCKRSRKNPKEKRRKPPPGFPEACRSAYALFCKDRSHDIGPPPQLPDEEAASASASASASATPASSSAALPGDAQDKESEGERKAPKKINKGTWKLSELRRIWKELPDDEVKQYETLEIQDQQRFRSEFEHWQETNTEEQWGDASAWIPASISKPHKVQRPRTNVTHRLSYSNPDSLGAIIHGASLLKGPKPKKPEAVEANPLDDAAPLDDGDGGAGGDPKEDATAMVDEMLGDLDLIGAASVRSGRSTNSQSDAASISDRASNQGWGDGPSGAPCSFGPQLVLDESGNMVLNQASLTRNVQHEEDLSAEGVFATVNQYSSAYRRTKAATWDQAETDKFYEALGLYGTDLFLVQTFFKNKSAANVKTKYTNEWKRDPKRMTNVLTKKFDKSKLSKVTFEKMHGKIDTSKHWQPPPEPVPGEEPEQDGKSQASAGDRSPDAQGGFEEQYSPGDPEYTEEEQRETTDRLMALFD